MSPTERLPPRWTTAALAFVFVAALLLRLNGVRFGLPALNDRDELMFEMGLVRMFSGSALNPGWFGHPATTTIYLLAVINALAFAGGWALGYWPSPKAFADKIYFDPGIAILPSLSVTPVASMCTMSCAARCSTTRSRKPGASARTWTMAR